MYLEKFNKKEIFILINIFLLILHVNTDPIFTNSTYLFESGFLGITKFLRSVIPYIIFINLLIYFFLTDNKNIIKISPIYWLFILYCLIQLVGLLFSKNDNLNIVWFFSFFLTIILFGNDDSNFVKKKFYLIILLFGVVFIIFFTPSIYKFFTTSYNFHNYYPDSFSPYPDDTLNKNDRLSIHTMVAGESPPRSSGMSRLSLVLIIFFIFYDLKKAHFLKKFLIIFFSVSLFLYQSRIILANYFIIVILISIYDFKLKNFFNKIKLYLLVPLLISILILSFKSYLNNEKFENLNIETINPDLTSNEIVRPFNINSSFDSGRVNIWKKILSHQDLNHFIGSGPQADRFLINQSASNALIYSIASAGLFGIFFIFGVYLYVIKKFFFYYFINKKNIKENWLIYCSIFTLFFIITRSLVETTFAVFSLDLLILITCIGILENEKNSTN